MKAWAWYEMGMRARRTTRLATRRSLGAKCFAAISEEKTEYPLFMNMFNKWDSMTNVEASKLLSAVKDQFSVTEFGLQSVPKDGKTSCLSLGSLPHAPSSSSTSLRESFRQSIGDGADVKKEKVLLENLCKVKARTV